MEKRRKERKKDIEMKRRYENKRYGKTGDEETISKRKMRSRNKRWTKKEKKKKKQQEKRR